MSSKQQAILEPILEVKNVKKSTFYDNINIPVYPSTYTSDPS